MTENEPPHGGAAAAAEQAAAPPSEARKRRGFLSSLGPGLIAGASDDDPSGIATYSQAGAQFGYGMNWVMLFSYPLMAAIQEVSARIGRVTGHGIAGNIRAYYSPWLLRAIVSLLVIANVVNLGADLGAMGDALRLLVGGSANLYVVAFAAICALLEIFSDYARYVSILKWTTLFLFAYVATILVIDVPWRAVVRATLIPSFEWNPEYIVAIVAVLGTTISPYLFFWQASQEAEDERVDADAHPLIEAPEQAADEIRRIRLDTYVGMGVSNLVALFIIVATAATLHPHGITDIRTSAEAAQALRPIAGDFAFAVFTIGIIGMGMIAVPVLAGSAAYAFGEAMGWPTGLARLPKDAKAFYGTIVIATLVGIFINFTSIDPMKALFWSAVLNGIISVPLMATMMIMAREPGIMGPFVLPRWLQFMGWMSTLTMAFIVAAMFWTWPV